MIYSPKMNETETALLRKTQIREGAWSHGGQPVSHLEDAEVAALKRLVEETTGEDAYYAQSILDKRQLFEANRQNFIDRQNTVGSDLFSLSK
jgi:hypothetical protein